MRSFRLCYARTRSDLPRGITNSGRPKPPAPAVDAHVAAEPRLSDDQGFLTILIGSNGSGKTRLLSGIAEAFLEIERAQLAERSLRRFPLRELMYVIGDHTYTVQCEEPGSVLSWRDGDLCSFLTLELPEKVIALTITPHDRFPLNSPVRTLKPTPQEASYKYLGLRDRTGRASMLSFLYSALENLLNAEGEGRERRDRITGVFSLLNYKPRIDITYSLRMSRERVELALESENFVEHLTTFQARRVEEVLRTPGGYERFKSALLLAQDLQDTRRLITVSADLSDSSSDLGHIIQLQMLRRTGFLSIRSIEVEKNSGIFVDLKDASSGELSIASTLIALASVLDDGCLVLIDEPEISLHPEWQSSYIEELLNTFRSYKGVHYLVATHSPLIVGDSPAQATVVSLDRRATINGSDVTGGSVDRLLAQLFKVPTISNLFIRDEIVRALRMAADGEAGSEEFGDLVQALSSMAQDIPEQEPVREVIGALVGTHNAERPK